MTLVRFLLAALLVLAASTAGAAPAPLPRPNRNADLAAYERLKQELSRRGYRLEDLFPAGYNAWIVTIVIERISEPARRRRHYYVEAPHRLAALRAVAEVAAERELR
jgi:hypothetical protein